MRILSSSEMQTCDRVTTERYGISGIQLMRAAAEAVACFAREQFSAARRVTVLCGRGNNGGDGMMAARILAEAGLNITVILLGNPESLKGDAAAAWSELASCRVHIVESAEELAQLADARNTDLLIDAVVGTGFTPPLRELALAAQEWALRCVAPVLAVDLPSGWMADVKNAMAEGPVFAADAVITFTAPKPAHVFGHLTRRWNQPVVVVPIGSPDEVVVSEQKLHWTGSAMELVQSPREIGANKGNFGHVLVVGGSFGATGGKAGAPAMAAMAAMRVGAGLVTAAVPVAAMSAVAAIAPELMTWPLEMNEAGQIAAEQMKPALLAAGKTVLAVGPGLGQGWETAQFFSKLLCGTTIPVVIDADGLNMLAANAALMEDLSAQAHKGRVVVLTPHPGEMARLAATTVAEVQADRLGTARNFAQRTGMMVVLKGARTVIAQPDGEIAVNTTGNPGMAKGGSGDVLAGMIAGLLAQYPQDAARAVEAAVYLHGLSADLAVCDGNEHTLLATDCLTRFSQAFCFEARQGNGYVWLQGLPLARQTREAIA